MSAYLEPVIRAPVHSSITTNPWGLYIHIPFCEKKCPYCDFNTYANLNALFPATVDALCTEMEQWRTRLGSRPLTSIFLGGGTPTVLTASQLAQLFETVHRCFQLSPDCEITCEANPGTVDRPKFKALHHLGVNRLSIGVQSFQPEELQFLGRIHDVDDVVRAFGAARDAGFANINLDFIFGLPDQPVENWQATLTQAIGLAPEHLSLYSLIVEPNTPLQHWVQSGVVRAPDDDNAAILYELAMARLADAGYMQYEVSNWAKDTATPGLSAGIPAVAPPRLASQHNLLYWRNQEYLGIGPGAHSHLRIETTDDQLVSQRWGNRKPVAGYVKRINQGESVEESSEMISPRESMGETMMLGLRLLQEGVAFERFQTLHQAAMPTVFATELAKLRDWHLLDIDEQRVRLTRQGLMMGNQVFAEFLP